MGTAFSAVVTKMATLRKAVLLATAHARISQQLNARQFSRSSAVLGNYWNQDWKPGPIPRTAEERAAAAKKYGIRPEDYKVLAEDKDDHQGRMVLHHLGDYPNLPVASHAMRDPWEDWDHPQDRRNYGDIIHHDAEVPGTEWYDKNRPGPGGIPHKSVWFRWCATFFGIWIMWFLLEPYPIFPPMMPKQYPFNNLYIEQVGDPKEEPTVVHYKI